MMEKLILETLVPSHVMIIMNFYKVAVQGLVRMMVPGVVQRPCAQEVAIYACMVISLEHKLYMSSNSVIKVKFMLLAEYNDVV